MTLNAVLVALAQVGLRRFRVRTDRNEVHQAGEGDDPELHGVNYVATIELRERLDIRQKAVSIGNRAYQKSIS